MELRPDKEILERALDDDYIAPPYTGGGKRKAPPAQRESVQPGEKKKS